MIERNANMCDDCFVSIDLHRRSEIIGSQQLCFFLLQSNCKKIGAEWRMIDTSISFIQHIYIYTCKQ